jgi:predicted phage tail protein
MNRKVYLVGEIEKKFGAEFSVNATSYSDIIKCIDCNRPGFKQYLLQCHEDNIGFTIKTAGEDIDEENLLTPLKEGDVTIAAIPSGSKSDTMKIISAIALISISIAIGNLPGAGQQLTTLGSFLAKATMAVGVNLGMQGIQGMLAPDPATEAEEEEGYLYTGDTNLIIEGDPVPLLYGELRVAGQPISIAVNNSTTASLADEDLLYQWPSGTPGVFIENDADYNSFLFGEV